MKESCRQDVRGQPNWKQRLACMLVVVHVIFFRPNGVWTRRVIRYTCHGFELRPGKSARLARARLPSIGKEGADSLSKGIILADGGSWHTGQSSKSIFSTMTTFHVTVNGWPVSTGIRLLWNESLWLESAIFAFFRTERAVWKVTRRKKLTREVLSVLMVAQKSTRRRVEWIKWGLFTVGAFVWSTPHCTVCPARCLVSSSSVCNPSSDPFVKFYR